MNKSKNSAKAIPLAILFTDIVGSTNFFASKGDRAGLAMLERHNRALFPLVSVANGRIVKTIGDSIFAVFERPDDALCAAFSMQRLLSEMRNQPHEEDIPHIRIGVHYGLVTEVGKDVFGDAVNLGERVKSAAEGDQILASRTLREMLRANPQFVMQSVGVKELKGAPEPMELFELTAAPLLPSVSGWQVWSQRPKRAVASHWGKMAGALALLAVLAGAALWKYQPRYLSMVYRGVPFEHFTLERMNDSEHVHDTAISPDGTYLASIIRGAKGSPALSLHHFPTNSDHLLLQDPDYYYWNPVFSPDGGYIYFLSELVTVFHSTGTRDLYRIPILGGQPELIVKDVDDGPVSFFPDKAKGDQRICIYRGRPERADGSSTWQLISASAEGGDEHVLLSGHEPYPREMACSPDGRRAVMSEIDGQHVAILEFSTGASKSLLRADQQKDLSLSEMQWKRDATGIFATGSGAGFEKQVLFISYPQGQINRITSDLDEYSGLSLTADDRILATRQIEVNRKVEILSLDDPAHLEEQRPPHIESVIWLNMDKIIVSSEDPTEFTLKALNINTGEIAAINSKSLSLRGITACGPDSVVGNSWVENHSKLVIFKIPTDGGAAIQLTHGTYDQGQACSPDGKWLYYISYDADPSLATPRKMQLVRLPIGGQSAQPLISPGESIEGWRVSPNCPFALSPDGKFVAIWKFEDKKLGIGILSAEDMKSVRTLMWPYDISESQLIEFAADGKTLFVSRIDEHLPGTVLEKVLIDKPTPVKIAEFPREDIDAIKASPDGTKLAVIVETRRSTAVLLREAE